MYSKFASQLKGAVALTCVAGLLSISSSAFAAPFSISQAPQDQGSTWGSSVSVGVQNAESFTMSGAGTLQQIDWWGIEDEPGGNPISAGGFLLRLYDSAAGGTTPIFSCGYGVLACNQAPVASSTTLTGDGFPMAKYSVVFASPLSLVAGTYFLSISNEESEWYWLSSLEGDGKALYRGSDDDDWLDIEPNLAFAVSGVYADNTVPEPGSLALLGLAGLLAVGAGLRSRRLQTSLRA